MTETKLRIRRKALRKSHKIQFKDNNIKFFKMKEKKRKSKIINNQYFWIKKNERETNFWNKGLSSKGILYHGEYAKL